MFRQRYLGPQRAARPSGKPSGRFMPLGSRHDTALIAEKCRRSFREFVATFWGTADPRPFIPGYHIDAKCDHLQAVTERKIANLGICEPPGHAKSMIASVLWPAWEWTHNPSEQNLFFSFDLNLALRDSMRCRMLIDSDEYQNTFQPLWGFRSDQNQKSYYVNTLMGSRYTGAIYSEKKLGWRANKILIDDPLSSKHRFNNEIKSKCNNIFDTELSSRFNDPNHSIFVLIMQRLACNDLAGHIKEKRKNWEWLILPSEFKPAKRYFTSIGWTDPRTKEGELLFPELFPAEKIEQIKTEELPPADYSAQHDQEPVPEGGASFQRKWFRYWEWGDIEHYTIKLYDWNGNAKVHPLQQCSFFVSNDSAVGEKRQNDYTVYIIYGKTPDGQLFIIDRYKDRIPEPESIQWAVQTYRDRRFAGHPLSYFAVEGNGVGKPLSQQMEAASLPVICIDVHTDKLVMSTSARVWYSAGRIYHPRVAPWLADYEENVVNFPLMEHDDDVSSLSIGVESLSGSTGAISSGKPVVVPKRGHNGTGRDWDRREGEQTNGNGSSFEVPRRNINGVRR